MGCAIMPPYQAVKSAAVLESLKSHFVISFSTILREVSKMEDLNKYLGRLYSSEEVATLLNIEIQTLYKWLREGRIKGMKLANSLWRVREADLRTFVQYAMEDGRR
jgi:excisionase family DNA binding protein